MTLYYYKLTGYNSWTEPGNQSLSLYMRDSAETKLKSPHIPLIKFKDSPAHKRWHSQVTTKAATPNQLNYNILKIHQLILSLYLPWSKKYTFTFKDSLKTMSFVNRSCKYTSHTSQVATEAYVQIQLSPRPNLAHVYFPTSLIVDLQGGILQDDVNSNTFITG